MELTILRTTQLAGFQAWLRLRGFETRPTDGGLQARGSQGWLFVTTNQSAKEWLVIPHGLVVEARKYERRKQKALNIGLYGALGMQPPAGR